jgi:hypothetical protein
VLAAQEEFERAKAGYVEQYKGFLERYKDGLFESQIEYIQKKIKRFQKVGSPRSLSSYKLP